MKNFILAGLLLIFAMIAGLSFAYIRFSQPFSQVDTTEQLFMVHPGRSVTSIARQLEENGLIRSASQFSLYARLSGQAGRIKVGEYALNPTMLPTEVLATLTSGKSVAHAVTFQEGLNMFEMALLIEEKGLATSAEFLAVARDQQFIKQLLGQSLPSLEGYLFPETYNFTKLMGARDIAKTMVEHFLSTMYEIENQSNKVSMPRHELVTLASIIEKETGVPEERGLVSSVFHNRLKKNMLLQTDPTVMYGVLDQTGKILENIKRSDLLTPTRYNTYTKKGLPFGPISNPGRESLIAALNPEESDYLFFVSRNDGTHIFSENYGDHNKAVRDFQINRKAREGRSWKEFSRKNNGQ